MRLAKLDEEIIDRILAVSIKTKDGKKLVNEGTILSEKLIERLVNNGLSAVYIEDDNVDIQVHETLDDDKRAIVYTRLQSIYVSIERNDFNSTELSKFVRLDLLPELKNEPVSIPTNQIMSKDDYIAHAINTAILSVRTAHNMGMNMDKIEQMAFIALVHDIGKVLKEKDIKLKNIPHYEIAFDFLKKKNCAVLSYMAVRFQEEPFDGTGVYKVTKDKQIDFAKILGVCDFYENLLRTTNLMPYECFEATQALVNTKLDPEVFEAFRDALYIYPIGLPVRLNNKIEGIIIKQNASYPLRPIVKATDNYYNLMENLSLFIEKIAM